MPGGYKKINGKDGNTFTKKNQPKNRGRKPSIRRQLTELLEADGKLLIDPSSVLAINEDGSIVIKIPTEMHLAMKLKKIATGSKANEALKAIQMIMEQIDGKPKQETETTLKGEATDTWLNAFKNLT